ncbi:TetR/AcrR family transcriptional regulator [Paradevosia shaoguanensis]|uniref:TetR/AcrR family transcriptional regulator n=1 Tax=Paradevosia shaoguanensis TaxID=1335043 RepID=UPI001931C152|nr:TetR/AcrR family transcriptional regulator [Paradevosia shaoguanensis]
MARPRTVSDEAILDAALGVAHRRGPANVTFASVSEVAGLSPATLVQRFGSKEALLRAALERAWDFLDAATAREDERQPLTPEGAVQIVTELWPATEADDAYAEGLLLLYEDMRDPILRQRGVTWRTALTRALGRRLSNDPARQALMGQLMASQWQGAQIWWAFGREGRGRDVVAGELRAWLEAVGMER